MASRMGTPERKVPRMVLLPSALPPGAMKPELIPIGVFLSWRLSAVVVLIQMGDDLDGRQCLARLSQVPPAFRPSPYACSIP